MLLVISGFMIYEAYTEHSRRTIRQMETEATRIDRALILEIEHSSHLIQSIGQQITNMDVSDLRNIAILLRSFDTTTTVHHVFSWIDAKGNNVVSSNKGVHKPVDASDRDFVQKATATPWKIQIGTPIQGRVSNLWALPVAMGVTDTTGKYIGTILISMDIYTITRDLQNAIQESGFYFAIYSNTLLPLTQSAKENQSVPFDIYSRNLKSVDLARHRSGVLSTANFLNKDAMYAYYEMSATYPYVIILALDNAANIHALHSAILPRLMEIMMLGFLILTLLWLVQARMIKPIVELAVITSGIIRGGTYTDPKSNGVSEIQVLAQQIKRLGEYLSEVRLIEEENRNKNIILRNAKEAADLTNKIKIEFLKNMLHKLRNPLNTIIGFSEIMKNQNSATFDKEKYLQYAQDIHLAGKQLQYLTEDMQKLSNAETKLAELQEKHIDIRFLLNKCQLNVAKTFPGKKPDIELRLPEVMPRLLMDERHLEQIITNIVLNILRNNAEHSSIVIRAYIEKDQKGNDCFCISFTDSKAGTEQKKNVELQKSAAKYDLSHLGIPLTKALATMHQVQIEIKTVMFKPAIIILRFQKERLAY